jgi:hypothetical protein
MSDPNVNAPEQDDPANEQTADSSSSSPAPTPTREEALRDAFMLGWGIVELKGRIISTQYKTNEAGLRLASVWRAAFNRIAALQLKSFTTNSTAETLYEPPGPDALPYLYPPTPDYANIGIVVPKGADDMPILADFKLYEVLRRAINCLTLLYVNKDESLIPDILERNKAHLVKAILDATKNADEGGGDPAPPPDSTQPQDDLQRAKQALTERTAKFLDAWDGYLRENYYAEGSIPNNDLELVAYEAGHSMSSLSWGIAVQIAPLEQKQQNTTTTQADSVPSQGDSAPSQDGDDPHSAEVIGKWQTVFRDQDVIRLQHQITALSSALDDEYYAKPNAPKRPEEGAVLVAANPDLPSQAIQAVKRSLDYWQNTVKWMAVPDNLKSLRTSVAPDAAHWGKSMRLALNEQSNIWQTLMTGQQSLRAYSMESITHDIMQDITVEIQKGLRTGFSESVQQAEKLAQALAKEASKAIQQARAAAVHGLDELLGLSKQRIYWVVGGVILVALLLGGIALAAGQNGNNSLGVFSGGATVSGVISAILGYFGLGKLQGAKEQRQAQVENAHEAAETKVSKQAEGAADAGADGGGLLSRIEGAAGQAGSMIMKALTQGYEQARIELDGLGRSVAVAYPLVEFFGTSFQLGADASFLTEIIWSKMERNEEIARVTRAAFGPLAVFITPTGAGSQNGDEAPQTVVVVQTAGQTAAGPVT